MATLVWLAASLILFLGEFFLADFALLMLAGGALAAAGASAAGAPLWLEVVTFAVVSVALVALVRPTLRRRIAAKDKTAALESRPTELAGRQASVTEAVTSTTGIVKIGGDFWSARTLSPDMEFGEGEQVTIVQIKGNTAIVDAPL